MNKLFVVQKYVIAENVEDAIKNEKGTKVHECFIDQKWKEEQINKYDSSFALVKDYKNKKIGFKKNDKFR